MSDGRSHWLKGYLLLGFPEDFGVEEGVSPCGYVRVIEHLCSDCAGFPQITDTLFGVPMIIRTIVFWVLSWDPPIFWETTRRATQHFDAMQPQPQPGLDKSVSDELLKVGITHKI